MKEKKNIKNVFCDRDGTIIYDKHYLAAPEDVELLPNSAYALKRLHEAGVRIFIVTNQSGIGRGLFSLQDYEACAARLYDMLASSGIPLSGSAFCPHSPDEACNCRKPNPGMWEYLEKKFELVASESVMIGDKAEDMAFGNSLGFAATILVLTGKGTATAGKLGLPEIDSTTDNAFISFADSRQNKIENPAFPDAVASNLGGAFAYITENFILVKQG